MHEYVEYDSTNQGNLDIQEHEIVADWLSTKYLYSLLYNLVVGEKKLEADEMLSVFTQITTLYWISLTIEFQIFDTLHNVQIKDCVNSTHPHPAVRLYSNLDAMLEGMADIWVLRGAEEDEAENYAKRIIKEFYIIIESFLQITDSPINMKKDEIEVSEYYVKLREVPYLKKHEIDHYFHLVELPGEYKEMLKKYNDIL